LLSTYVRQHTTLKVTGSSIFLLIPNPIMPIKRDDPHTNFIRREERVGDLMFEPEYENVTCPKCYNRELYFDRQMGHYCMFCGRQFRPEEVEALREHELCQLNTGG